MTDISGATVATPVLPIVRVAILADSRITEVALPAQVPLREIMPAVFRLLPEHDEEQEDTGVPRRLSLAPIGGATFSLDATLDTVGVVDGDLLALQPVPAGPAAPGIVEDIADAAVIFSESRTRPWGAQHIEKAARAAVVAVLLAGTGLAVAHRLATGHAVGLYAVAALAALAVVAALLLRARSAQPAAELAAVALIPVGAAFALAVPGEFGAAQVILAAAGVTAWSLISLILSERALSFFTATTVIGFGVLLAGAASAIWDLPLLALGCGLLVLALLVTVQAAQLSAVWARLPLPVIPAPGDPAPTAPSIKVLEDLPRRVRISDAHQTGFIAGAVVLSVLGSLAVIGDATAIRPAAWYVVIATAVAAVLRARVWDSAACKAWLLAQPYLAGVCLLVLFAVQGHYWPALWTFVVLALAALVWVFVAANPKLASPETYSLPLRRLVGFLGAGIDASLIPVMAFLVGLFSWVLNR
ncbi:type VII secretion integral membrane protein EccD [Mycobacterium sp. ACS4331]|uniref:type VII secretion integral membrane protein EccD n=1 Tax=Mycobacterium sp. ACS4331 TaxID=1834121 RepID=UPI000800BB59|nr:type VII secretion integral membrane protein EccD [Mycobacterium sp. ACS4331]OBF16351.1 type VII secretion integral membrane protein EccD [Mycobacterium sp. ACS4331]